MEKYRKFCAETTVLVSELKETAEYKAGKVILNSKLFNALARMVADTEKTFNRDMMFNVREERRRMYERFKLGGKAKGQDSNGA
ncbi:MAG TPA: hypothetical protein ENI81_02865 [Phycisphaerales bacterium]|nr:hypothetical protein [Phycisphaerales bacterium]